MEEHRYIEISADEMEQLMGADLPASALKIYLAHKVISLEGREPTTKELRASAGGGKALSKGTFYDSLDKLSRAGLIEWNKREVLSPEKGVRDRLHQALGGAIEVTTAFGRIDLLTDTEVIEVKEIKSWKAALGQVLVYGSLFPEHRKRLHLFGQPSEWELSQIRSACGEYDVIVSFEYTEAAVHD